MKKKTSKFKVLLMSTVLLSTIGLCSAAQAATTIQLSVNTDKLKLEIQTRGNCGSSSQNGCIKANGSSPVTFTLTGKKKCSDSESWKLDRVAIRGSEDGSDGEDLPAEAGNDFNVNMNTGVLVDENGGSGNILIRNSNKHVFTVWYNVYATCGGEEINADPRMINNGTG
jgi:hypothetical protein